MQESLYIASSAGMKQQRKLDVLANNLANASSPGFKRDNLVFEELLPPFRLDNNFETAKNQVLEPPLANSTAAYVTVSGTATDFKQGPLTTSGNRLDLALEGDGFFAVQTENGIRYTRKGNFRLDDHYRMITSSGYIVMSTKNDVLTLPASAEDITVDPAGQISVYLNGQNLPVGQMKVVHFEDPNLLEKEGNSLFRNKDPNAKELPALETQIRRGFVENSNVNIVEEMTQMITTHRAFEAYQRIIQTVDTANDQSINSIGRVA